MSYATRVYRQRNAHVHDDMKQQPFFPKQDDTSKSGQKRAFFQAKLTVNEPGDSYEQEADAVANTIVNKQLNTAPIMQQKKISNIQRMGAEPEKEKLKGIRKKDDPLKEEDKNKTASVQTKLEGKSAQASSYISSKIETTQGKGTVLPAKTLNEMSSSFGTDFSDVRIHSDREAAGMSEELNAQAFTHENDIYFNKGKYSPENKEGKFLLAHELTHVLQQNDGKQKISKSGLNEQIQTQPSPEPSSISPQDLMDQADRERINLLLRAEFRVRQLQIACEEQADPSLLMQALPEEVRAFVSWLGLSPFDESFCSAVSLVKSDISKNLSMQMLPFFFASETDEFCEIPILRPLANYEGSQIRICPRLVNPATSYLSLRALTLIHEMFHEPSFGMSHNTPDEMSPENCGFLGLDKAVGNPYCITNIIGQLGGNVIF